jgi:hypothetical protein
MEIYQWRTNLLDAEISSSAKLIGFVLTEFYRKGKECFPSITTLTESSGLGSRNTTIKAVKELEASGLIIIDKKRMLNNSRKSNTYIFYGIDNEPRSELSNEPSSELSNEPSLSILESTKPTKPKKETISTKQKIKEFEDWDFKTDKLFMEWITKQVDINPEWGDLMTPRRVLNAKDDLITKIVETPSKYKNYKSNLQTFIKNSCKWELERKNGR